MSDINQNNLDGVSKFNLFLNRNFFVIKTISFIIVIAIGVAFVALPKFIKINKDRDGQLKNKTEQLADMEAYLTTLKTLSSSTQTFEQNQAANLQLFVQVLPKSKDLANLIAQMEAVTRVSGFTLNSLSITENGANKQDDTTGGKVNSGAGQLHSLDINLSLSGGGYDTFKDLLENLERHIRLLDVNSISFSNPDETGAYNLTLTTYYYSENNNQT